MSNLSSLFDYIFHDPKLLEQALTHSSFGEENYERLEFVGDRVLNLVIAEMLYQRYPHKTEGELAKHHAALVREESLNLVCEKLGLYHHIRLGTGELVTNGQDKPSIRADVVEAVIAALFLDGGFNLARKFVLHNFEPLVETVQLQDSKSFLQELLQADEHDLPVYEVIAKIGHAHERIFRMKVTCEYGCAFGEGRSKQAASQAAAAEVLRRIGKL